MKTVKSIKHDKFTAGDGKFIVLAGPCATESYDISARVAEGLKTFTEKVGVDYVFKCSFDKANRTSINSYRGLGIEKGLELLAKIKSEFDLPVVTDIHLPEQAEIAAEVADIIQIPAFLSRQTDILVAAAKTGKVINIKKGQFLSPYQMNSAAQKVEESGNDKIIITDRGVSFGYNNLVADMRTAGIIHELGYPMIFDATHSVQLPGAGNGCSSGERKFVEPLAKAAVASGADGLFLEVHPEPDKALCDGPNMLDIPAAQNLIKVTRDIFNLLRAK